MIIKQKTRETSFHKTSRDQAGFVLIAALTLLASLTLLGTTAYILTSTDSKVAANFKTNQMTLQVAMAGAEKARELLRQENLAAGDSTTFNDELNSATRKGANGILNGYSTTTDDVALASGTMNNVSYAAYLTNDSADGTSNTTDSNGRVLITSVASGPNNAQTQVQIVVTSYTPPSSPAVLYSKGDVTGNGSSLTISGNDACGATGGLAPIYTKDPATTTLNGTPTLSGSPPTPQQGTMDIDIQSYVDALKSGATVLTEDTNNATYGSSSSYVTVYSDTSNPPNVNGLKLDNVTGYGILVVKGDLILGGGFQWNGLIFATGSITLNGGGGPGINISGLIFSGTSSVTDVTINGGNTIGYNSCQVKKAAAAQPLKVVNWRQLY